MEPAALFPTRCDLFSVGGGFQGRLDAVELKLSARMANSSHTASPMVPVERGTQESK